MFENIICLLFIATEHFATADGELTEPFFITIEESSLFQAAYPEIVAQYQMEKLDICKEKRRGKLGASRSALIYVTEKPSFIIFLLFL